MTATKSRAMAATRAPISIGAGSERGLIHAAADLLEKLGARFAPGVAPSYPHIELGRSPRIKPFRVTPAFKRRAFVSDIMTWNYSLPDRLELHLRHDREFIPWMARRGINAFSYIRHAHDTRLKIDEIQPLFADHGIAPSTAATSCSSCCRASASRATPDFFPPPTTERGWRGQSLRLESRGDRVGPRRRARVCARVSGK